MDKMSVYNRLPIILQNVACGLEGARINRTRYGKDFWRLLAEYENRANWSYDQLAEYRDAKLRKMIKHCYETVPYYTRLFNEGGVNPDSIKCLDDLKVLPILTKSVVNKNPEDFVSTAIPKSKMVTMHTSGTTGSSFIFQTTQEAICEQWAVWWRYRRALGIEFGTEQAMFGTKPIVPIDQKRPPYWRISAPTHQCYFSQSHMSDKTLEGYCQEINKRNLRWIHGHPSVVSILASYVIRSGHEFSNPIRIVSLGSENVLDIQKRQIEKAFGVEPYQHYGAMEGVANFSENLSHVMEVDEDCGVAEFISAEDGQGCRVVGTTLSNYAMPLVRWALNDIVNIETNSEGKRIITEIDGRLEDCISLPDGRKVGRLSHVFKDTIHIREAQIQQKSDYSIEILIIRELEDTAEDEAKALTILRGSLSYDVPITFKYVDAIPRMKNGKFRAVISEIK